MKKITALVICVVFVLGMLSACGGSKAPASNESGNSETSAAKSETPKSETPKSADKVELEFFVQKTEQVKVFNDFSQKYMDQNPNVTIKNNTPADSEKVLQTRMASNDMPDIWTNWPTRPAFHAQCLSGHVLEITGSPFLDLINEDVLKNSPIKVDGKMYAVPISYAPTGVFYNVKMFKDNNLEVPKTYDELINVAKQLKSKNITAFGFCDSEVHRVAQSWYIAETSIVPDKFDYYKSLTESAGKANTNENEKKLGQIMLELREYGNKDSLGTNYSQVVNMFATGECAMIITGSWSLPSVREANPNLEMSAFPFPGITEENTYVMMGNDCGISVASSSKNKDTALDFLSFLCKSDFPKAYCNSDGSISTFKGVVTDVKEVKLLNEYVNKGKWKEWAHMFWPISVNNTDHRKAIQNFIATKDMELLFQEVDKVFEPARKK